MRWGLIYTLLALAVILFGNGIGPDLPGGLIGTETETADSNEVTGTFGFDSGVGAELQRENALQAMRFKNTVATGTLTRLELLFSTSDPLGKVRMGVYADNHGVPGDLLIDAGETRVTDGWVSIPDLNLQVTQGGYYWLSYNLENANPVCYRDKQVLDSHYRVNDYVYGPLPGAFPDTDLINDGQWVMRATVTGVVSRPAASIPLVTPAENGQSGAVFDPTGCENPLRLTIDHTKIAADLFNFPLLVSLGAASGTSRTDVSRIFDDSGNNRQKIAVTLEDKKTQCYIELEKWDAVKKQAFLWVKVPQISSAADTVLYLFLDHNQPDNLAYVGESGSKPGQSVWDDHFVGVWHMEETGTGAAGEFKDSTARNHNGTGGGGRPDRAPLRVSSKIGDGQSFNGRNSYIEIPDDDDFSIDTSGQLTISGWISPAVLNFNTEDFIRWMGKGAPDEAEYVFVIYNQNTEVAGGDSTRSNWISFYVNSPQGGLGAGGGGPVGHTLVKGEWIYFCATTDMLKTNMGFNGNPPQKSELWSSYGIKYANGSDPLRIGTDYRRWNDWWNGQIDEIRISNVCRSEAWIKADYYSENDDLIKLEIVDGQLPGPISDSDNVTVTETPGPQSTPKPNLSTPFNTDILPSSVQENNFSWPAFFGLTSSIFMAFVISVLIINRRNRKS